MIEWATINQRRCKLIEKSIAGTITRAELEELESLQIYADEYLETHAPRTTGELERLEKIVKGESSV